MSTDISILNNVAIVLVHPKFPENIGAAARSAYNMGLSRLILVSDEQPEHKAMAKMATHHALHILEDMEIHQKLEDALAPFAYIVGTTARRGRQRGKEQSPRQIVEELARFLPNNQVALVFGPEDTGLSNDELKYCQSVSAIPTTEFSSLNLAQAVAIHCYELYHGVIHERKDLQPAAQCASSFELEGMYHHVEEALVQIDFLEEKNHSYWMNNIRRFLGRMELTSKESNIIRGICRNFMRYQEHYEER